MAVEREQLIRTVQLARLHLSEQELAQLTTDLNRILEQVEELLAVAVDPEATAPLGASPAPAERPDVPDPDPLQHPLAALAPDWRGGYFTVPRVLAP